MALGTGLRVCAVAASLAAIAACGGGGNAPATTPPPQAEPVFKPVDPSAPAILPTPPAGGSEPIAMVTDLASGWPITLRVGQSMLARLTADRAAGMRWSLRPGSDGGIVALAGEPTYEATAGSPGVEVFRLTATKPGRTTLTFDYRKGSDPIALKSASYPVTVQ
jgi:predicted secreted protein